MMRALIVDDREDNCCFLAALLKGNGWEVDVACNGADALEVAARNPPQLIISDLLMPVMDGYTLLRKWKADGRFQRIPFVVYTATYTDPKDEELALRLGADAFILKPVEPDEFMTRIGQMLAAEPSPVIAPAAVSSPTSPLLIAIASPVVEEELHTLRQYSQALVRKLEDKMEELERKNRELQRDLAERRRVEAAYERLATAVDQAGEAILITDIHGTIQYVNPAFETISGYHRTEALGNNPRMLRSGTHDGAFYRKMWESLAHGIVWSGRLVNKRKDGSFYHAETTISPVRDVTGNLTNYVGVQRDVTQEVALEEQLRQAQKMEAIGQLAGGVAHDFNNILAAMLMQLGMLLNSQVLDQPTRKGLQDLETYATRASGLTRQLLLFGRRSVMEIRTLDLNEVVSHLLKLLRRLLGEHIQIDFQQESPSWVEGDAGMLEQVLMNLAVNARDAMPKGGRLLIKTRTVELDAPTATSQTEAAAGLHVCLSVVDEGCGMTTATLEHIFEPFFTTKPVGKGTGLGLATVYGIVKQHRGWVEVDSTPGKGSTFRVWLPANKMPPSAPASISPAEPVAGGNETILLVEDEASLRYQVARCLGMFGYEVLEASNPLEAVTLWQRRSHDIALLFTDMVMPGGDTGLDLADRLRSEKPELEVVLSSGYSTEIQKPEDRRLDGVLYLPKPFGATLLGAVVRACLDGAPPPPAQRPACSARYPQHPV